MTTNDRESNARRQSEFKARKIAQGFKRRAVWIREADWQLGYDAGLAGGSLQEPPGVDGFSYSSGYIEGRAKRINSGGEE